jgi:amino acid permease
MEIYELDIWPTKPSADWITGLATIFLSYSCHPIFFYLRGELRSKTKARISKIIRNSLGIECLLYLCIGVAGYLSLGKNLTPDIFFLRKALRKPYKLEAELNSLIAGMKDNLMQAIKWIFIVVTILHVPVYLFAVRDQCYTFFKFKRTTKNHLLISSFLTLTSFSIPIVYPHVIRLLGLIGGLCSTTICVIVPIILYIRIQGKPTFEGSF